MCEHIDFISFQMLVDTLQSARLLCLVCFPDTYFSITFCNLTF